MPLFRLGVGKVIQIKPVPFFKERNLQKLFEDNLETLLGVRFIASEFTTGDRQRGRIDSLGLDQDESPVIIEYKKTNKDNIINQGLFYLDWLVDHQGDFTLAAQQALGKEIRIDWSQPRLILIAESFSEYDKFAVNRIGANIELWTYRLYNEDLLYLDPIYVAAYEKEKRAVRKGKDNNKDKDAEVPIYTLEEHLKGKPVDIRNIFEELREQIFALDEEGVILEKANKHYVVYKHGKNFCEVWIQNNQLKLWLDIPPSDLDDPFNIAKNVTNVGHWGTGDVEVNISSQEELTKVMPLITQAYQQTV